MRECWRVGEAREHKIKESSCDERHTSNYIIEEQMYNFAVIIRPGNINN